MDRRTYLSIIGCTSVSLAGCSGDRTNSTTEPEDTAATSRQQNTPQTTSSVTEHQTSTPEKTRTPSELASNPEFKFEGNGPGVRELEIEDGRQFAIFTVQSESESNLNLSVLSDTKLEEASISLDGKMYTSQGEYLDKGKYNLEVGSDSTDWTIEVSLISDAPTDSLPAKMSGKGQSVIGKYEFDGHTRFSVVESPNKIISVRLLAPNSERSITVSDVAVEEISGQYFMECDADGAWTLELQNEDTNQ